MGFLPILAGVMLIVVVLQNRETLRPKQARLLISITQKMGLFILLCACASFVWAQRGIVGAQAAPTTPVSIAEFSETSLTGTLNEVLLEGYFQLDHMVSLRFPREIATMNQETSLIPITDADWQNGDPVTAYMIPNWFSVATEAKDLPAAKAKEGFPATAKGAVHQTRLMAKAELHSFKGDAAATIIAAGPPATEQVVVLQLIDKNRGKLIQRAFEGPMVLAKTLAGLGAFLLLINFLARRFLPGSDR